MAADDEQTALPLADLPDLEDRLADEPVLGAGTPTTEQPPTVDPKPHGRAGRDLRAAIAVGVVLAVVVLGSVLLLPVAFVAVVLVAVVIGSREMLGALRQVGVRPPLVPVAVAGVATAAAAWFAGPAGVAGGVLLSVLGLGALAVTQDPARVRRDLPAAVLVVLYVGGLAGFALLLLRPDDGAARVLLYVAATAASDIGGYAAGVLTGGRHKMSPTISPGKSWEGFVGSMTASGLLTAAWVPLAFDAPWWSGLLLGALLAAVATAGDLGMSLLKRDVGVKDMGRLLPGHGGLMDRLDSLLVVAPVMWVGLELLAPVAG